MGKSLRSWRLTPIKDSDLWKQSSYRGEVWVRAYDAIEARNLTAQRFRVRPPSGDRRRARIVSPWYLRELVRSEIGEDSRFNFIEIPCVVCPVPDGKAIPETANADVQRPAIVEKRATDAIHNSALAHVERASRDIVASDIRRAIVALLLGKEIDVAGRWLDVYVMEAADEAPMYVIIPAVKLKRFIAEELAPLISRTLDEQETRWILRQEDVEKLLGTTATKLRVA